MSNEKTFKWCNQILKTPTYIKELKDYELEDLSQYVHSSIRESKKKCMDIASLNVTEDRDFEMILQDLLSSHSWYNNYLQIKNITDDEIIRRDYLGYEVDIDVDKFKSKKSKFALLEVLGVLDYLKNTNPKTKEIYRNSMKNFYSIISIILGYENEITPTSGTFRSLDSRDGTDHKDVKNMPSIENCILLELEKFGYK
ncbi:hypothetical protein N9C25_00220 [Saprospiraceae bacterium]|nr:hypothetical protein [Saprospiraceae bacterium]